MTDYVQKLLPRFRYGVILPRANEEVQRSRSYQLYRLLPLDFMEISTGLGLENYTKEGVEKAVKNYWPCVERLAKEKLDGSKVFAHLLGKSAGAMHQASERMAERRPSRIPIRRRFRWCVTCSRVSKRTPILSRPLPRY